MAPLQFTSRATRSLGGGQGGMGRGPKISLGGIGGLFQAVNIPLLITIVFLNQLGVI